MEAEKVEVVEVVKDALDGMAIRTHADITTGDALKIGAIAGVVVLAGSIGYSTALSWLNRRKLKKLYENQDSTP